MLRVTIKNYRCFSDEHPLVIDYVRIPTQGERGFRRMVNGDSDDVERGFRRMLNDLAGMSEMLFKMPDKRPGKRGGAVCGDSNQGLSGSLPFPKGSAQCQQNGLPCDVFGKFYASSTSALCPTGRSPRRCAYPRGQSAIT